MDMNIQINHFGLIPDGTRRWARNNNYDLFEAYVIAMKKISDFLDALFEQGVSSISVYLLSTDNLKRKPEYLVPVIDAEIMLFEKLLMPVVDKYDVRVIHAGRSELLPRNYKESLEFLCSQTSSKNSRRLYLLAAYNPIDEIAYAINKTVQGEVSMKDFFVPEMLDLIVRSSGESRLSNFLPLQAGYAELIIEQKHFNDMSMLDIYHYLTEFENRNRRFGK